MYYIYILQSQKDRSYYTGITEDLKQRLREHNAGPFKIAFYCAFKDKKKALDFEKYLKSSSGFAFARKRFI
ncbi:GIY-YIG nuclease family protein [Candidatus Giovannonibacteria bacterium]|nr:GIY-YIG nuclease family protein [Candidatus Giovannonibacteria bacterium]